MPHTDRDHSLLLTLTCIEGGRIVVSPLGSDYQIARFAADGRLTFVTSRGGYPEACRAARAMAGGSTSASIAHLTR